MRFDELGLSEKVLNAVQASGYETPTPIQAQAIPHALQGRDVLGIAQTGTGKTAAFTLPMLSLLEKGRARAR
ncbi:MAG: DEAD/DEAH box helicase, partial [Hyphomicrobiales bacterium]|nr:DEAD/DEAH box helicase [Hyphomicrobiales bacterium]